MASLPTPGASDVWGTQLNTAIESLHLGPDTHANRPTTGLVKNTLYSCTDHNLIYRWGGSAWATYATLGSTSAASTTFTPTGNIAATNVQAALAEVDSEKETPAGAQSKADGAVSTHTAAADPHPQYLTQAEGDAAYAPKAPVVARVYQATGQAVPNATATTMAFDAETFDPYGFHSTTTNTSRLTVPAGYAGYYTIAGTVAFPPNNTAGREAQIYKNGSLYSVADAAAIGAGGMSTRSHISDVAYLAEGDYVELGGYQASGGSLTTEATWTWLAVIRHGGAA